MVPDTLFLSRAQEIYKLAIENKSKGSPLDDMAIVTAAHQVNSRQKKLGKPNNRANWIDDDNPLNFLEEGLDKGLDIASEYGTSAMAAIGINSIFGNPAGKLWSGAGSAYNKLTGKPTNGIFDKSPNKTTDSSTNNQSDKSGSEGKFHNETPHTTNFAGQPTQSHSSNSKSILSKMGEKIKNPFTIMSPEKQTT